MLSRGLPLALIVLLPALSGCSKPRKPAAPVSLKLEKYAGELKTITLKKEDKSYRFLFDTGGGYTILDSAFAETFGCSPYGRTVGFRLTGEKIESRNCNALTLDLGNLKVETAPKVMDLNGLLPDGLPKLAGLLSLQTFRNKLITIDYAAGAVTVETPESFASRIRDMAEIPLKVTEELDGESVAMFTRVLEKPEPLWFYMDSGNLRGVLVPPYTAKLLGVDGRGPVTLTIAGKPYRTRTETLDMIYDGALDVRFFKAYVVALDLENSRAWVRKSRVD